jgi:transposase-like protein
MNSETLKCPVCGATMSRVKVLPAKFAGLVRFRCTCGHCQDLKDNEASRYQNARELVALDGFQELP